MIEDISVSITFQGDTFSPKKAIEHSELEFTEMCEIGELGKSGKYKGKPIPYGYGTIETPKEIPNDKRIIWLAKLLEGKIEILKSCGAEDPHIYIGYFFKNQCNLSLSKNELAAISKLGVDFWFSCYDVTEEKC